jgi:hypothetical protein
MNKKQFKELQVQWYKTLAANGFNDIEKMGNSELLLKQTANHCYCNEDAFSWKFKEEYYAVLGQIIQDEETYFSNEIDKYILSRHAEGIKIKAIMEELHDLGMGRARDSIRFIIRRYEQQWKIKSYNRKQLNLK